MTNEPGSPTSGGAAAYARRWLVAYLLVYILPFPLTAVPVLEVLASFPHDFWDALMGWVGETLLGVTAVRRYTGSGDTMLHYVELLSFAALATVAATVWHLRAGGGPVSGLVLDRTRALVRLFLGVYMLMYGIQKVIPVQMPAPGPSALVVPLGDFQPSDLLWLFIGASVPYQMILGLAELVGGALLFWRRTTLPGAIVCAIVMSQVFALNMCFDVGVKLLSAHLLLCALFLVAQDARRLWCCLLLRGAVEARPVDPYPLATTRRRRVVAAVKVVFVLHVTVMFTWFSYDFYAAPPAPLTGVYRVESFTGGAAPRWTRVGIGGRVGALIRDDGHAERFALRFDDAARTITWTPDSAARPFVLRYTESTPDSLQLEGEIDGVPTSAVLRRVDDTFALTSHSFQWVQEGRYVQHKR